ncbi:hypothetical protein J2X31_003588 [Flavobacterium arsenatis]|uniref:DUF1266 domain-containing protein n=1 Tax=Flavobacterium arsenatis TaxID=1484332 RepID=A0ABU1TUK6_9FLAO|nr:DUF1266 domain-containing protein [Flavobacterium arsenatis]MDR6969555.1 hypothetical protein [Flavobacterium arsenatis]
MGFFSKLLNTFKSIRLNEKNAVNGQLLDHLLVGSMYAEQQSAYLNSYETGLNTSIIKELVESYWDIYSKEDALLILQDLHDRNQDNYLDIVYKAFEDKENYVQILKSDLPNEKEVFEYYLNLYRKLNNIVPELIEHKVITNFSEIKKTKDSGWNYGRATFLARCCFELGYLTENELKDYLEKTYKALKINCSTWKEYTTSYIFGRAIWGGPNNSGMIQIADDLLNHPKSPLNRKNYL